MNMDTDSDPDPDTDNVADEIACILARSEIDSETEAELVDQTIQCALNATAADEIPRGITKTSLPALLLALIEIRENEHHGGALLEDLERGFGQTFSPGSVYPVLHDLHDDGLLEARERVKTKDYRFRDREAAYKRIEDVAEQHAAMARFLHAALEELDE